ncbi:MAG: Ig-like domain-containing protein [Pedobacter sp.]
MKKILFVISILAMGTMIVSCGGGGSSETTTSKTSLVTLVVGGNGQTASIIIENNTIFAQARIFAKKMLHLNNSAFAAIPEGVVKIGFSISAPDDPDFVPPKIKDVDASGLDNITKILYVKNGNNRHFIVEAKDGSENVLYRGEQIANLNGTPVTLSLDMLDVALPTITSVSLESIDFGEGTTAQITVNFSEPMDEASIIDSAAYKIACSGDCSALDISSISPGTDNRSVVLTLSYDYQCYMTFDLTVSTTVKDLAGNSMANDYAWTYYTGCNNF